MSTIYITKQGSSVYKESGQISVRKGGEILQNVPETQVRKLILVGNINLSTPLISFCLEKDIEVVYLTQGGKFKGRLVGNGRRNAEIRVRQYDLAKDKIFRLRQARAIVAGKIRNQIDFAVRQGEANSKEINLLRRSLEKARNAVGTEQLLGIEGSSTAAYFKMFGRWCPKLWRFVKRSSNPPKNEVNALLSLSYTLIYNRLESFLNLAGLDAFQGFFHAPKDGHAALASDLNEEFRAVFCDALVLKLIRRRQLTPGDFQKGNNKILLNKEGLKIYFTEFEKKLQSRRKNVKGENITFQEIMKRQVYQFAKVIRGRKKTYEPYSLRQI